MFSRFHLFEYQCENSDSSNSQLSKKICLFLLELVASILLVALVTSWITCQPNDVSTGLLISPASTIESGNLKPQRSHHYHRSSRGPPPISLFEVSVEYSAANAAQSSPLFSFSITSWPDLVYQRECALPKPALLRKQSLVISSNNLVRRDQPEYFSIAYE